MSHAQGSTLDPYGTDDDDFAVNYTAADADARLYRVWGGLPAVIYVRISKADLDAIKQAKAAGATEDKKTALHKKVRAHLARCEDFACRAGLEVTARFTEDNLSASLQRGMLGGQLRPLPQRDALLEHLHGCVRDTVVLTTEVPRLYRSVAEGQQLIRAATRMNRRRPKASLFILDIGEQTFDLSTLKGRDLLDGALVAAQAEATAISTRRAAKELDRAKAGLYFGRRPFGYTQDKDRVTGTFNGRLTIKDGREAGARTVSYQPSRDERPDTNPGVDEAGLIRKAATRILDDAAADPDRSPSLGAIARDWNAAGVTTSWGNQWTGGTVALLLQRPLLIGIREHRPGDADGRPPKDFEPGRYKGDWEPILDRATFRRVRAILTSERRLTNKSRDNHLKTALSGLAWCGACEGRLVSAPMRTGRTDRRLRCPGCGKVARAVTPVEAWARRVVLFWLGDGGPYRDCRARMRATVNLGELAGQAEQLTAQIAAKDREIAAYQDIGIDGGINPGTGAPFEAADVLIILGGLRTARKTLIGRRGALEAQAAAARRPGDDDGTLDLTKAEHWESATAAERRDWLRRYVAKVIIHPNPPGLPRHWFDPLAITEVTPAAWWTGPGHPGYPPATVICPPKAPPRRCGLDGCEAPHRAHGLCKLHLRRQWEAARAGHPDVWDRSPAPHRGRPAPGTPPRPCDLPGCGRPHDSHGLCGMHLTRKRAAERAGRPDDWDRRPVGHRGRRDPGTS